MTATIRQVTVIPTLLHWRKEVIENVFGVEPTNAMMLSNRQYYIRHIADGTHIAIVAETDGHDVGCGAICITEELPSPDNLSGKCAYLMNIYVRAEYRKRGIGHSIVSWLVEKATQLGCDKIYLETTDDARTLYQGLGFNELNGIMKYE